MVVTYPCTGLIAPNAMEVLMRSPSGWGTHGVPDRVGRVRAARAKQDGTADRTYSLYLKKNRGQ